MARMTSKTGVRRGILCGGNLVVDRVKIVNAFPRRGTLVNILEQTRGTGGAALNNSINLKVLDPKLPVAVMGRLGDDADGRLIMDAMRKLRIGTTHVRTSRTATAYTDVFTEQTGGARTFFHFRGANAEWDRGDIDFDALSGFRIVHIGYILLLDRLDAPDKKYGTRMAGVLAEFRRRGVKTAVDVVTDLSGDFRTKVTAALRHTDYLVLNEIEAAETTGIPARDAGDEVKRDNIFAAAEKLMRLGDGTACVVIHMPEGACGLEAGGTPFWVPSLRVPEKDIKGTAGAGDAFASGILYALHEGRPLEEAIRLAHGMAAKCLYSPTCTGGAVSFKELIRFIKSHSKAR
ncbi:MAG: carbohydrate kinase family protein [Planctomycetota bacterium]